MAVYKRPSNDTRRLWAGISRRDDGSLTQASFAAQVIEQAKVSIFNKASLNVSYAQYRQVFFLAINAGKMALS